jgi:hypothetical protein
MVFIYVLKLKENKFYIGKTNNPSFRLQDHTNGNGSTWTTKYNPIKLMELVPNCDAFDEDKYTLKYMELVGIDNVRGGSFCQINLSDENKSTIQKMLSGTTDKCYNCGEDGHFASKCPKNNTKDPNLSENNIITCSKCKLLEHTVCNVSQEDIDEISRLKEKIKNKKEKLNNPFNFFSDNKKKEEHLYKLVNFIQNLDVIKDKYKYKKETDVKLDVVFGCQYCGKEFDTKKGATFHENVHCKQKQEVFGCQYCGKEFDTKKGATFHENVHCKQKHEVFKCQYCGKEFDTNKGATFHENVHCKQKHSDI